MAAPLTLDPADAAAADVLMAGFAARTGLAPEGDGPRHLWTDAWAVANLLGLARDTGDTGDRDLALALVDRVRAGGAEPAEEDVGIALLSGCARAKWMHALDLVARETGDLRYGTWARELADVAHRARTGLRDPLDGYVTCLQLRATGAPGPDLDQAVADFEALVAEVDPRADDPLGLGELLLDAARLAQLKDQGAPVRPGLVLQLVDAARDGLEAWVARGELDLPAGRRLAFRELGLATGLAAVQVLREALGPEPRVDALAPFELLRAQIVGFWRDPVHQGDPSWTEHQDIDEVMLATALAPSGMVHLGTTAPSPPRRGPEL